MGWDAPSHWLILAVLVIALFGYKKLPDASRALGRSLRIFKTEVKGMSEDDKAREAAATPAVEGTVVQPPAAEQPTAPAAAPAPVSTEKPTTSAS